MGRRTQTTETAKERSAVSNQQDNSAGQSEFDADMEKLERCASTVFGALDFLQGRDRQLVVEGLLGAESTSTEGVAAA